MFDFAQGAFIGDSSAAARLGFGCSNLLGGKTRAEALELLETAYESGVRHFDVARYYGYGDAERLVGEFARNKREHVTITTKFGLSPMKSVSKFKGPLQFARRMMRSSTFIRNLVKRQVSSLVERGQFDIPSSRASLETSLRELQCDYIDCYLLHEATAADCSPELLDFLEDARSAGKIKTFGVGSAYAKIDALVTQWTAVAKVVQFDAGILNSHLETFKHAHAACGATTITHGILSDLRPVEERLSADPLFRKRCSEALGLDVTTGNRLAGAIVQQALRANADGLVLFRSSSPERIRANIRAATDPVFDRPQLDAFSQLVKSAFDQPAAAERSANARASGP